jgi:hypothetical protein
MKTILAKPFFRKYGKKALIIYVCWCFLKGGFAPGWMVAILDT